MKKEPIYISVYNSYLKGFQNMKLGKKLWFIIIFKFIVLFFILKLFFFPSYLGQFKGDRAKEEYVLKELIDRAFIP